MNKNKMGLSWLEWLAAAGFSAGEHVKPHVLERLVASWEKGEDPSDFRRMLPILRDERKGVPDGEHISKITCPKCGNTDLQKFRYVEKIECYRQVQGVSGGVLQVESRYQTGEGYDDGTDPYFECHADFQPKKDSIATETCLHRLEVPDFIAEKIDWV